MHILISPNAFKNSLDAGSAAEAIEQGLRDSNLNCTCECFPVGDGGDGTGELLAKRFNGKEVTAEVHDPLRRNIKAFFWLTGDCTAVIEMANASGIKLLKHDELDPLHATSFGTGELIRNALDDGAQKIILCIGGSATVDGGSGILQALGIRFLDAGNSVLDPSPANMVHLASIDLSGLDKRVLARELIILCDVENKLLGENGAARIFGPQKGAAPDDVERLEAALSQFNEIGFQQTGKEMAALKHGGAAGGVAAGLAVFLDAKLVNGIEYFLNITSFDRALQKADLVITGEGSIDEQTLQGKGPYGVAKKAKEKNIPVIAVTGRISLSDKSDLEKYFDLMFTISDEPDVPIAMKHTKSNLVKTAKAIGDSIGSGSILGHLL